MSIASRVGSGRAYRVLSVLHAVLALLLLSLLRNPRPSEGPGLAWPGGEPSLLSIFETDSPGFPVVCAPRFPRCRLNIAEQNRAPRRLKSRVDSRAAPRLAPPFPPYCYSTLFHTIPYFGSRCTRSYPNRFVLYPASLLRR